MNCFFCMSRSIDQSVSQSVNERSFVLVLFFLLLILLDFSSSYSVRLYCSDNSNHWRGGVVKKTHFFASRHHLHDHLLTMEDFNIYTSTLNSYSSTSLSLLQVSMSQRMRRKKNLYIYIDTHNMLVIECRPKETEEKRVALSLWAHWQLDKKNKSCENSEHDAREKELSRTPSQFGRSI